MELDDLKRAWDEQQKRVDERLRLNERQLRSSTLGRARGRLDWLARGLWVELLLNLAGMLWLGSFAAGHVQEARFLLPAVALMAGAAALVAVGVRQLAALGGLDYGAEVLALQRRLEALRVQRIRATTWTLLLAPLAWPPLLVVGLRGFLGIDAYAALGLPWLAANAVFGVAVLIAARWVSARFADRMSRSPAVQAWMRTLAGHQLNAATAYLASLDELTAARP